jgi:membrane protease YdiL (CAAX protease family)
MHGYHGGAISREIIWTVFRLISAAVVYCLFRQMIHPRAAARRARFPAVFVLLGLVAAAAPALVMHAALAFPLNYLLGATSLAVAVREELVYRAVLQPLLTARCGLATSLIISNVIFTLYHFGAESFTPLNLIQIFAMGTILGLIYHQTRSLLLVIALHAIYDAGFCFAPLLHSPLSPACFIGILLVVLAVLAVKCFTSPTGPKTVK